MAGGRLGLSSSETLTCGGKHAPKVAHCTSGKLAFVLEGDFGTGPLQKSTRAPSEPGGQLPQHGRPQGPQAAAAMSCTTGSHTSQPPDACTEQSDRLRDTQALNARKSRSPTPSCRLTPSCRQALFKYHKSSLPRVTGDTQGPSNPLRKGVTSLPTFPTKSRARAPPPPTVTGDRGHLWLLRLRPWARLYSSGVESPKSRGSG